MLQSSDYLSQNFTNTIFTNDSWVVLSAIEQTIKSKIEKRGKILKDWDINIYRGILTGYNEAFIISKATRDKLVSASSKNAEIIRPILRGRDIKSYNINFANNWLINAHNGVKSTGMARVQVEEYPEIFEHLQQYEQTLQTRFDKGDHWTNLRNCAYAEEFEKEKIVWLELTDKPNFAIDNNGFYINNTIFFMTGNHLKYLLGFLNSRICEWYFDKIAATSGVGTRRWIKIYIDQICVPLPRLDYEQKINSLVDKMIDNPSVENRKNIEEVFFNIFNLTEAEIELIETAKL
jgi:hypothetical protein